MANVLLIDSTLVDKQQFYDSANSNTFPIIYDYKSKTDDLLALFRQKFPASSIQRISLVFHDKGTNFMAAFMNNKPLFEEIDLAEGQTSFSENASFLISCINEFHVAHIDFLACNTLQYSNWKSYYELLASQTAVVVGASNDKTGNLNYGGDWVMENTHENVKDLYFNANISNYASTLAAITISADGASDTIYLQMSSGDMQYSIGSVPGSWTTIASGDWPVSITNSALTPGPTNVLRVVATEDLIISSSTGGVNGYFIAGSSYITFDGSGNTITIDTITDYLGLIQNGTSGADGFGNVIVKNFITAISGSTLADYAGWLCQEYFGKGVLGNEITNCTNSGEISGQYAGGIAGQNAGANSGSASFTDCTNSGIISGVGAGGITGSGGGSATFDGCTNSGIISGQGAGGIAGQFAGENGSATFTECTNDAEISGQEAGGIAGQYAGANSGSATFTDCTNTGEISGGSAGGIAGQYAGYDGSAIFTNCTNSGEISGGSAGGIAGLFAGANSGSVEFTNCENNGVISGDDAGGIAGQNAAANSGSATFDGCTNNGIISGDYAGGIAGSGAGNNGSAGFTNCTNTGEISGISAGGIAGYNAGVNGSASFTDCANTGVISGGAAGGIAGLSAGENGSADFTGCTNSGEISGEGTGGIVGPAAGSLSGSATLTNCFSTGLISGLYAGGIAGSAFAGNTSINCVISECYSTGAISGSNAGGIVGASVGYTDDPLIIPNVNIENSYSLGAIATTAGGICGGETPGQPPYAATPIITITNCYSFGTIADTGSGIVSILYPEATIKPRTYFANNNWSDAAANVFLIDTPSRTLTINNPAAVWTTLATNTPYILSAYNAALYSPNSASTSSSTYESPAGLFSPGYTYRLFYTSQVGNVITAYVFASQGTAPYYYAYNSNTFTLTTTLSVLSSITINPSTGALYFILSSPSQPNSGGRNVPMISGGGGAFWFGREGFLFKSKGGGGARRSTKMAPGGNTTCNGPSYIYNKFKPGGGGVGASSVANRRAKNRLATVCSGQKCFPCYPTLGQYSNYTHNPNGYVPCPAPTTTNPPVAITYSVTYNGNGNTGGTAPVDSSSPYSPGSSVTILDEGSLTKTGDFLYAWNTAPNGSGTSYLIGETFTINANIILYAIWYSDG
jgi:hypothetical protein